MTRDIFATQMAGAEVSFYAARTSLASLAARGVNIPWNDFPSKPFGNDTFSRKMAYYDITKATFGLFRNAAPEVLLLDFIDERFNLLVNGDKCVTRSTGLVQSNLHRTLFGDYTQVKRIDAHQLWFDSCEKVAPLIGGLAEKVVLHRARYAERYCAEGEIIDYQGEKLAHAQEANGWLDAYYDHFEKCLPSALTLRIDDQHMVADLNHRWGEAFFHYYQNYYAQAEERLRILCGDTGQ